MKLFPGTRGSADGLERKKALSLYIRGNERLAGV
jgi:hypothetical protein